jgi:hypothetical protein
MNNVIPGRRQRVRAKRGPTATNPESSSAYDFWIPGLRLRSAIADRKAHPGMTMQKNQPDNGVRE